MILDVHDSVVFEVPTERAMEAARLLKEIMEKEVPAYFRSNLGKIVGIPLFAEVAVGPTWGTAEALDIQ